MAVFSFSLVFLLILRKCELASVASNVSFSSTSLPPTQPLPGLSGGSANNANSNWPLILLVCALGIAVVAVVIQLFCCCCNGKRKKKYPEHEDERKVLLYEPEQIDIVEKKQQPRSVRNESNEDFHTGVLRPVKQQLQTDQSFDPGESKDSHDVPKGLVNIGNTCYFNAVLQCLNHTYALGTKLYAPQQCGTLTASFKEFLNLMQCEKRPCIVPNYLHSVFCELASRFADGMQHDSHECLRHFLEILRKEERAIWSTGTHDEKERSLTLVDKLFGGHIMTIYTCNTCEEPYHVCEPFLDISLPLILTDAHSSDSTESVSLFQANEGLETDSDEITRRASLYREAAKLVVTRLNSRSSDKLQKSQPCPSVEDCLSYFTRPESMADGYLCNSCCKTDPQNQSNSGVQLTSAMKQTVILNPPAILTLHLKRFQQKPSGFVKINTRISYEELLDISPYTSLWCMRNEKQEENIWYALYAVVVHIGSTLKSGHYVAYVKVRDNDHDLERFIQKNYFDRSVSVDQLIEMMKQWKVTEGQKNSPWKAKVQSGTWYRMCDAEVSRAKATEVLNQNAYLLFYERVDSQDP